jgi:aminoglycoside phosphotransferase (APT) family kinase protein
MQAAWTSDRYPSPEDIAERYSKVSGRELTDWNFYLALANFKLGVIGEGITHRARSGSSSGAGAEQAATATGEFMAAGLRAINNKS